MNTKQRVICSKGNYRVVEDFDQVSALDDLKGDVFCPKANPDIPEEQLIIDFKAFEQRIWDEGVWGYELQQWVPKIGIGWVTIDSCYGFIGMYNKDTNDHYIVEEFKARILCEEGV